MNCSDLSVPVVLGLGSNNEYQGLSPVQLLEKACILLGSRLSCLKTSSVYVTKAMYYEDQSDFHNMVVMGNFSGTPQELLTCINQIEAELGRNRSKEFRNGPRSMDIDIELFGNLQVNTENLQIPHPRITERAFVLIPMLEIFHKDAEPLNIELFNAGYYEKCLQTLPDQGVRRLGTPRI